MSRAFVVLLIVAVLFSSCASMNAEDQRFYGLYLTDPHPVPVDSSHRPPGVMAICSFLLPGLGELICGQVGWGFFWLLIGSITWPIGPPIAAYVDAETANKEWVAEAYKPIYMAEKSRDQQEREKERDEDRRDRRFGSGRAPSVNVVAPNV